MHTYKVVGLMSGTSLDGLDIAFCQFDISDAGKWNWSIIDCETVGYPIELKNKLKKSIEMPALDLHYLDVELGKYFGDTVHSFINRNNHQVDFIASHGHTVFHAPANDLTVQIGNANFLHSITKLPVISDFRTLDIANGGQGAPLVPIGDQLLFSDYDICINLGGIANLSFEDSNGDRIAYDICICNILLNRLAQFKNLEFDKDGALAQKGELKETLLNQWNSFSFLNQKPPKSLGIEQLEPEILSKIDSNRYSIEDMLATAVEHIAFQISKSVKQSKKEGAILFTGGGAFNQYLIKSLTEKLGSEYRIELTTTEIKNYKEALIFAFLGVLNVRNEYNTFSSVTGAHINSISGQKLGRF